MEETISLVLHGCKLAKDLEQSLQNINVSVISPNNNQQVVDMVFKSCTEISRVFGSAVERLASVVSLSELEPEPAGVHRSDPSLQDWLLRHGVTQAAMDLILEQQINLAGRPVVGSSSAALEMMMSDETVGAGVSAVDSGGGALLTASSHRVRKRKNEGKKRTIRARAPPGGNAELPPDDIYTWRKYGQKEILGSIYPRAYYRCTHQKMYNCPAKKQVQRADTDFHTFQVTYIGDHTCHMSATAPSIPPPPQPPSDTTSTHDQSLPQLPPVPHQWLSMDFNAGPSGSGGSTAAGRGSGGAGPSTSRYGKDVDYPGVEELADAMFNSGNSSGGNSMDFIFSTVDHRWERGDKKQD